MEKKEIRKQVFQIRKSSDPVELEKKSQIINQKIIELPAFQNADTIFVYMDCKGEVSVRRCWKQHGQWERKQPHRK